MSKSRLRIAQPFTSSKSLLLNPFFANPFPFCHFHLLDDESPFSTTSFHHHLYLENLSCRLLKKESKCGREEEEDWKYKWTEEIKDGKTRLKKSYRWTVQIQPTYTVKISNSRGETGSEAESYNKTNHKDEKSKKKKSKDSSAPESSDRAAIVLNQVFANGMEKRKSKRKQLSAQDAAIFIQLSFRDYLIRRSQSSTALRKLAIAKARLKELRAAFSSFPYRRRLSHNAEERQRFSQRIIDMLITIDSIQGVDFMVRAAKRLMVDELEGMMEIVDPHSNGKSWAVKRTMFDEEINKEVGQVVDQEASSYETFEARL